MEEKIEYEDLPFGFDLNNAIGHYRTILGQVVASLVNAPESLPGSGELVVDYYHANENGTYGIQVIRGRSGNSSYEYIRARNYTTWNSWRKVLYEETFPLKILIKNVSGTNKFTFNCSLDGTGTGNIRQAILLFGADNSGAVNGMITVNNGKACAWYGTGDVSLSMDESGLVTVTLPHVAYDTFTLISDREIS